MGTQKQLEVEDFLLVVVLIWLCSFGFISVFLFPFSFCRVCNTVFRGVSLPQLSSKGIFADGH